MSNTQLYLAVGLPILTILIALAVQMMAIFSIKTDLSKRMDGMESRIDARMDRFEDRMNRFENNLSEMRTTFIKDHTERLVRLEERVFHA